jgi:hypothetical protein
MQSHATTVEEYLASLPEDRRKSIATVRKVILKHLPKGYKETMRWGMISYEVPLSVEPNTYNGEPLGYAALASQKNHMALYLMNVYGSKENEEWFKAEYVKSGKKLDMGKSCVRFRTLEHLPLGVVAKAIARTPMDKYLATYWKLTKKRKERRAKK